LNGNREIHHRCHIADLPGWRGLWLLNFLKIH